LKIGFLSKVDVNIENIAKTFAPTPVISCRNKEELAKEIAGLEVLIVQNQGYGRDTVDAALIEKGKQLKLIQHHGVATDITDIAAARRCGIPVATIPGQNSRSVAEHAMYLLLAVVRRGRTVQRLLEEGRMGEVQCSELGGKTVCLVGLGTIGKMVAKMCSGFGMTVIGVRRDPAKDGGTVEGVSDIIAAAKLHDALKKSDFTILVLPLDDGTANIIDATAFDAMKDGAGLINVSRGGHVDRPALEAALESGRLSAYAADAYWSEPIDPNDPLLKDERVVVTPHTGGKSTESIARTAKAVYDNVMRVETGEPLRNVAN
jgi:phosphoglycerate dehydrogenase-like enzyme